MERKTDIAINHFKQGNLKEALRIAKSFRIGLTREDRDKLVRAYECLVHADFYRMLGKKPEQEIQLGKEVFESRIIKGA